MNKTTAIIGGIAAVVVIGGLIMYGIGSVNSHSSRNATSTSEGSVTTDTENQTVSVHTPQTPGTPSVVTSDKSFPTDTTVVVSGSVTPNGAFTNYWYEFGTTENFGNKTPNQNIGSGYTTLSAPAYITGLSKDTTYFFRLVANNQFGTIAGNRYSFQTSHGVSPPVGSAPSVQTMAATGISRTVANVSGEVIPNKSSTVFWFEYGKTPSLGYTTALGSIGDGSVKVPASMTLSDLSPVTTYYFRLDAQNQFGTVNGSILTLKTAGPPAPGAPAATTGTATKIGTLTSTLRGTVNPNGVATTYWFEYSTDAQFSQTLLSNTAQVSAGAGTNAMSASANISSLTRTTTYYFRVVAQNTLGVTRGELATFKTK